MRTLDLILFNLRLFQGHRYRTLMLLLAMAIGVTAVILLTGLGEAGKQYVVGEFGALGKNTLIMFPGKKETTGGMPPITGESPREITLEDAQLMQRVLGVDQVAPIVVGTLEVSAMGKRRESISVGTTREFFTIRDHNVKQGQILPALDWYRGGPVCVIGGGLKNELFGSESAIGQWLRVGQERMRIIGILESKGQSLGMDIDDLLIMPVANAQRIFNTSALFRVLIHVKSLQHIEKTQDNIIAFMKERHEGEEDVTVITQDSLLSAFEDIINTMTYAVAAIAAISLFVAGVLIMNVSLISVSQRTNEIGLLKALGATGRQIQQLFLFEAAMLSLLGALVGYLIAWALLNLLGTLYPNLVFTTPLWASLAAILLALMTALLFSWFPARKASRLPAVEALQQQQGMG